MDSIDISKLTSILTRPFPVRCGLTREFGSDRPVGGIDSTIEFPSRLIPQGDNRYVFATPAVTFHVLAKKPGGYWITLFSAETGEILFKYRPMTVGPRTTVHITLPEVR